MGSEIASWTRRFSHLALHTDCLPAFKETRFEHDWSTLGPKNNPELLQYEHLVLFLTCKAFQLHFSMLEVRVQ